MPADKAAGSTALLRPASIANRQAAAASRLRLVIARRPTEPMEGNASPRNPKGCDVCQIAIRQLRCGMALDREAQLLGIHAVTIIGDLDQGATAILQRHIDAPRPGIDGVFHQFLDRGSRPLDDLAGGDAVDDVGREKANRHKGNANRTALESLFRPWRCRGLGAIGGFGYSGVAGGAGRVPVTPVGWPRTRKRRLSAR